jgi:hypothetical protein
MTSAPGRGSLVSITFPLMDDAPDAPDAPDESLDDVVTAPLKHDGEGS